MKVVSLQLKGQVFKFGLANSHQIRHPFHFQMQIIALSAVKMLPSFGENSVRVRKP